MPVRMAREADVPAMVRIYAPYVEQTTYSFEYTPPDQRDFLRRFRDHIRQFPWLVWEEDGVVLGYAYAGAPWERAAYGWCAEISVYLSPRIHGRGIGRRLYAVLERLLAAQGYRVVYALVTTENEGSLNFHQALGYARRAVFPDCGYKMGRWLGVVWLEKRLAGCGGAAEFPVPWTALPEEILGEIDKIV